MFTVDLRAILVCVDYADLLALTLPYNKHHFKEIAVVTASHDVETIGVCEKHADKVSLVHVTDEFYAHGAKFNKWKALEDALDLFGRTGWMCVMDADVLWPKEFPDLLPRRGNLYTPLRRMMTDVKLPLPQESNWNRYPLHPQQREWAGYTQVFHSADPTLGKPPWHQLDWAHAGGADSFFQAKWNAQSKLRPPFEVLHLGEAGQNWCGRVSKRLDGSQDSRAGERYAALQRFLSERNRARRLGYPDPFAPERVNLLD
jgi:hypothetical protein